MTTFGPMSVLLWILAFGNALAAGLLVYRSDKRKGLARPWLTGFLRSLVILLVWLLLLSPTLPFRQTETRRQTVVLLQDDSRSTGAALGGDTGAFRQKLSALRQQLEKDVRVLSLSFGSVLRQDSGFRYADNATDISGALEAALSRAGKFPPAAILLATDGRYNAGSNPLYTSLPLTAPLHILSVGDTALEKDLRIGRIYAPRTVAKGNSFEVRADVLATGLPGLSTSASISGNGAGGTQAFTVSGDRFDRAVSFTLAAARAGVYAYALSLPTVPGERNTQNNTRRFYVEVVDRKKKILLAAAVPHPDIKAIREALSSVESYDVTVQVGTAVNTAGYDAAILHGLPASGSFATKIPTWYILTPATSVVAFNSAQKTVNVDGTTALQRFSYPLPPAGFSLFVPPAGLDALTDRLPPLSVSGTGWRMAADAQALLRQRENNAAPLWALRSGRPAEAVTVGEGLWRWRLSEYRQRKEQRIVDECIRQTVAFLAAGMGDKKFRLDMPKWEWNDGEGIILNGYLLNEGGQSVNNADAQITLTDSAGRARSYKMERVGSSYRLNIGSLLPGSYRFSGSAVLDGKTYTDGGAFVVTETPIELLQTGADYPFLQVLSTRFSGTVRPWQSADALLIELQKSDALKPRISQNEDPKPLIDWKWMFVLILGVATAEWLVRRYQS